MTSSERTGGRTGGPTGGRDPEVEPSPDDLAGRVAAVIGATRPGEVVTYGEVAAEAGAPGAARAVGRILRHSGGRLPWWRVVTAAGRLVPGLEGEHADRLEREGVAVDRARGRVSPSGAGGAQR